MTNAILMSDFLPGSVQLNMAFLLNRLHADFLMERSASAQTQRICTQCYQAVRILFYHILYCFELGTNDVYFEIAL